jgi:hypothetical protein
VICVVIDDKSLVGQRRVICVAIDDKSLEWAREELFVLFLMTKV